MANTKMEMGLVLTVFTMLFSGALAQTSCTNVLISLSPCLNYIMGNSSTPSSQCCTQLGNVVRSSPLCLCEVVNGDGSQLGLNFNQTLALALPGACNVQTPPISLCNDGSGGSPASSPAGPPNIFSGTDEGNGSKTPPLTDESSDGSSIKLSTVSLLVFLIAASYAAIFTTY